MVFFVTSQLLMKWVYYSIRAVIVVAIVLAAVVPAGLYVMLSIPSVQRSIKEKATTELTALTGMDVDIDDIYFAPFSRLTLRKVSVKDERGDTAISIDRLGAGINLPRLIFTGETVVTYAELIGLDAKIRRDSSSAPLNIEPLIRAFSHKNPNTESKDYNVEINTIVVRKTSLNYDVLNEPEDTGRFDANHIAVRNLRADLQLPKIAKGDIRMKLMRLAFEENSGFAVTGMSGYCAISDSSLTVSDFKIELPRSQVGLDTVFLSHLNQTMRIADDSYLNPVDLVQFLPQLSRINHRFDLDGEFRGYDGDVEIVDLDITGADDIGLWLRGAGVIENVRKADKIKLKFPRLGVGCNGDDAATIIGELTDLGPLVHTIICNLGGIDFLGELEGDASNGHMSATLITDVGVLTTGMKYVPVKWGHDVALSLNFDDMDGGKLFTGTSKALSSVGTFSGEMTAKGVIGDSKRLMEGECDLKSIVYRGKAYSDIILKGFIDGEYIGAKINSDNAGLALNVEAETGIGANNRSLTTSFKIEELDGNIIGGKLSDKSIEGRGVISAAWTSIDDIEGTADILGVKMNNSDGTVAEFGDIFLRAEVDSCDRVITLKSELVDAEARGRFSYTSLVDAVKNLAGGMFPSLVAQGKHAGESRSFADSLNLEATLKSTQMIDNLFKLPVKVIYPVNVYGSYIGKHKELNVSVDAPYLQQGNRLLENTTVTLQVSEDSTRARGNGDIYVSTLYPTKKGDMTLWLHANASSDCVDTKLNWKVARDRDFSGDMSLTTFFSRDSVGGLVSDVHINPSTMVFNDTAWSVSQSRVVIMPGEIDVDGFRIGRQNEYLSAEGKLSAYEQDSMVISLRDVNLDYVFETLDISTAMFGGIASGDLHASAALSNEPELYTDSLCVRRMSYNHSLMGDAVIKSRWDVPSKAVEIDAKISQPNGRLSYVDGKILPLSDSLDFYFDADRLEIGFMKPFMEAFTSSVSGYASGKARLWGSFKYIDMIGDIYAEDVRLKLDFTNTYYTATDSIRLTPGYIALDDITLRDDLGHTAKLNGWIKHEFFKQPRFKFAITDAWNMLVYDVKDTSEQPWGGKIYGNGGATVTGEPGKVDIDVNMSTAPNSTFKFVLTDTESASDYNFITFRDRDQVKKDSIAAATAPPPIVMELKKRIAGSAYGGSSSVYTMNIAVSANTNTQMTLVMDPVGGDKIKAYGNGNLRMTYDSSSEDLKMFGNYTLERGNYNFTLQDIIIKDFTIQDGSSISFHGDPYAAQLDIEAIYAVNANLSDLDESFLQDRELNRTNVPVHALLKVSGDMRQPDIDFDLEFPTLSQDTYRKVKSIVSTEDMMNRQIIYLLALSRFYTPDYMNATKGNEFVSVASSTISSQLGSILGQLSDNWSVAPQFRSDRGDFSDVEVDLALSSNLLNNRLLLNGNFGYRDKAMNSNSFIGDFDIEYLLNKSGNIRLKAYNRYNDRNFYVKSATTTQGVGIIFKRDFDDIFSFWRRLNKKKGKHKTVVNDTVNPNKSQSESVVTK